MAFCYLPTLGMYVCPRGSMVGFVEEAAYSCFLYGVGLDWRRGDMSGKVRGQGMDRG